MKKRKEAPLFAMGLAERSTPNKGKKLLS